MPQRVAGVGLRVWSTTPLRRVHSESCLCFTFLVTGVSHGNRVVFRYRLVRRFAGRHRLAWYIWVHAVIRASVHHAKPVATPRVWHRPRRTPLRPEAQTGQAGVAAPRVGMALPAGLRAGVVVDKACPARAARPARPLRVVRVLDAVATSPSAASAAGRMVISGRMADVCAELDRLAALEAASTAVARACRCSSSLRNMRR
jgi:hypothetical protein